MNSLALKSPSNRVLQPRRRFALVAGAIVLAGLIIADQRGWLLVRRSDDMAAYHGRKANTLRVIDGDTIEIDLPDSLNNTASTRVRLWGVNCPETTHANRPAQPWAVEAANLTEKLVKNQSVILWLESHRTRDPFAVVLAHVELTGGRSVNEELLSAGLAKADDRWPHSMLVRYAQVETNAKRRKLGVWSSSTRETR